MPSFPLDPTGYTTAHGWRPLRRKEPMQRGWDVFDLQCRLVALGRSVTRDGYFGDETHKKVSLFQQDHNLIVDGIAGVVTQVTSGKLVAASYSGELGLRVKGQMQRECSHLCGIYTPEYDDQWKSQDRGPVQMNNHWSVATDEQAFNVTSALAALVKTITEQHARFVEWKVPDDRAWAAAQGYWNNHRWAEQYARGEDVPQIFIEYIEAVTAYV